LNNRIKREKYNIAEQDRLSKHSEECGIEEYEKEDESHMQK